MIDLFSWSPILLFASLQTGSRCRWPCFARPGSAATAPTLLGCSWLQQIRILWFNSPHAPDALCREPACFNGSNNSLTAHAAPDGYLLRTQ